MPGGAVRCDFARLVGLFPHEIEAYERLRGCPICEERPARSIAQPAQLAQALALPFRNKIYCRQGAGYW